jgi:hypothetical protein
MRIPAVQSSTPARDPNELPPLSIADPLHGKIVRSVVDDHLQSIAAAVASGRTLSPSTAAYFSSQHWLDENRFRQISEQSQQYGSNNNGIRTSGADRWDDRYLADLYSRALHKESFRLFSEQQG